jgi:hypothetical protein
MKDPEITEDIHTWYIKPCISGLEQTKTEVTAINKLATVIPLKF